MEVGEMNTLEFEYTQSCSICGSCESALAASDSKLPRSGAVLWEFLLEQEVACGPTMSEESRRHTFLCGICLGIVVRCDVLRGAFHDGVELLKRKAAMMRRLDVGLSVCFTAPAAVVDQSREVAGNVHVVHGSSTVTCAPLVTQKEVPQAPNAAVVPMDTDLRGNGTASTAMEVEECDELDGTSLPRRASPCYSSLDDQPATDAEEDPSSLGLLVNLVSSLPEEPAAEVPPEPEVASSAAVGSSKKDRWFIVPSKKRKPRTLGRPFSKATSVYETASKKMCPICNATPAPGTYKLHFRTFHPDVPFRKAVFVASLACDQCPYKTRRADRLVSHQRRHGIGVVWHQCDACEEKFKAFGTLQMHKHRTHGKEKQFQCDKCDLAFVTLLSLKQHSRCHPDKLATLVCPHCNKVVFEHNYEKHAKRVHGAKGELESVTPGGGASEMTLSEQERRQQEASLLARMVSKRTKKKMCPVCGQDSFPTSYKDHFATAHPGMAFRTAAHAEILECPSCPFKTRVWKGFKAHRATHEDHDAVGNKRHKCRDCDRAFKTTAALKTHRHREHGEDNKEFLCDQCDGKFVSQGRLNDHLKRTHSAETRVCAECGEELLLKRYYLHMKLKHREKKTYACQACKSFVCKSKAGLDAHLGREHGIGDAHLKKRPVTECPECGKRVRDDGYKVHMMKAHGVQVPGLVELRCEFCDEVCFGQKALTVHVERHARE